jgi:prephenate dehydrogenase
MLHFERLGHPDFPMSTPSRRPHVAVIGLGLIGGSVGLALRRAGHRVTGTDRDRKARVAAVRRGAVSRVVSSPADAVASADLIVLCVPWQSMTSTLAICGRHAFARAVITDTVSVKAPVAALVRRVLRHPARFVGGHPMAGSERSGIAAASARLFEDRTVVLTPVGGTLPSAVRTVQRLWTACGARTVRMSPAAHDQAAAAISHVPHALAVTQAFGALTDARARGMVAGGFLDATRVATSSPALWEGIFHANAGPLLRALAARQRVERDLIRAIRSRDPRRLRFILRTAAARRRALAGRAR